MNEENKPGEIDRTGETLSPAAIQAELKKEAEGHTPEETPADKPIEKPVVKPEDKPAEKPVDPTEQKPADAPVVEPEPSITKPRTIYQDYKDQKKEKREAKSENELLKQQAADNATVIADLTKKLEAAVTPAEKQEVSDDIKALADELGTTPEQMAKLADYVTKKVQPQAANPVSPLSDDDKAALARVRETDARLAAETAFKEELTTFTPKLKEEFPDAQDTDMQAVTAEIDRLAHLPAYHDKPLAFILWENKAKLAKLVSPKRPSIGDGGTKQPSVPIPEADTVDYSEGVTPAGLSKSEARRPSNIEVKKSA